MAIVPMLRKTDIDETTHRKLKPINNVQFKLCKGTEGEKKKLEGELLKEESFWSTRTSFAVGQTCILFQVCP